MPVRRGRADALRTRRVATRLAQVRHALTPAHLAANVAAQWLRWRTLALVQPPPQPMAKCAQPRQHRGALLGGSHALERLPKGRGRRRLNLNKARDDITHARGDRQSAVEPTAAEEEDATNRW
eukprot:7033856-Prymnesium_polylepis.1